MLAREVVYEEEEEDKNEQEEESSAHNDFLQPNNIQQIFMRIHNSFALFSQHVWREMNSRSSA